MKRPLLRAMGILVAVGMLAFWGSGRADNSADKPVDAVVAAASGGATGMIQVTPGPQAMRASVAFLCRAPSPQKNSPHEQHYFDVYITPGGADVLRKRQGTFPIGTVILKRKYSDKDREGKVTELFTGMRKHEAGYNSEGGDWEYFVTSGDGQKVTSQGKLESCMSCHQTYEEYDFVTRDYSMSEKFLHPLGSAAEKQK